MIIAISFMRPTAWAEEITTRVEIPNGETRVFNNASASSYLVSDVPGGRISNAGTVIINGNSFFKKIDLYDSNGGVLANTGKATINQASFISNFSDLGGAI